MWIQHWSMRLDLVELLDWAKGSVKYWRTCCISFVLSKIKSHVFNKEIWLEKCMILDTLWKKKKAMFLSPFRCQFNLEFSCQNSSWAWTAFSKTVTASFSCRKRSSKTPFLLIWSWTKSRYVQSKGNLHLKDESRGRHSDSKASIQN